MLGELTPAEMHALEKQALDDPFLADALEGSASITHEDLTADLKMMETSLLNRIDNTRKLSPWVWPLRIAAGLLVLVLATYLLITISPTNKSANNLALNKPKEETNLSTQKDILTDTVNAHNNTEANRPLITPLLEPNTRQLLFRSEEAEPVDNVSELPREKPESNIIPNKTEQVQEEEIINRKSNDYAASDVQSEISSPSAPAVEMAPAEKKELIPAGKHSNDVSFNRGSAVKIVKGQVTDAEDGTALPGVTVKNKATQEIAITDAEGNYQLPLNDLNAKLIFSFIGLQEVEVPVNNQDSINIKMEADFASLSEVVVVGYAEKGSGFIPGDQAGYEVADPQGGKKAFKKYLVENVRYPQLALDNKVQGKVTVQFTVQQSGVLSDFKVLKGIGFGCDEEVIRLIQDGPKWKPAKNNEVPQKGRVKVRLRFTLPD